MNKALSVTTPTTSMVSEQTVGVPGAVQPLATDVSLFEEMLNDDPDRNQCELFSEATEETGENETVPLNSINSEEVGPTVNRQRSGVTNDLAVKPESHDPPATTLSPDRKLARDRVLPQESQSDLVHQLEDDRTPETSDGNTVFDVKRPESASHSSATPLKCLAVPVFENRAELPLVQAQPTSTPKLSSNISDSRPEHSPVFREFQSTDTGSSASVQPVTVSGPDVPVAMLPKMVDAPLADEPTTAENSTTLNPGVEQELVTQSEVDSNLTDGQPDHHDEPEPVAPLSLGDEVLRGLQGVGGQSEKRLTPATNEKLITYIEQVVDRIAIVETGRSELGDIHIALKDSVLPDTEVIVSRQHAVIVVSFLTRSDESAHLLETNQRLLESQLSGALDKPVSVSVDVSTDQQDGRSRGQRDLYTEMQEAES